MGLTWLPYVVAAAVLVTRDINAQRASPASDLRAKFGFSEADIARLDRGDAVTRRVAGLAGDEIAFVGAIRVRAPAALSASRVFAEDLAAESPSLLTRLGFSRPPTANDLRSYALPAGDVDALRRCELGDCELKLPGDAIAAFRLLDWRAADIAEQASAVMRRWLLAYVRAYVTRGNNALVVYEDGRTPLPLHEGFHTVLGALPQWADDAPEFHHYLDAFPRELLAGVRDTVTCYVEDFGLRPITTVVHSSLYRTPAASASAARPLIARLQIFASHYFRARLSMLAFIDAAPSASAAGPPGSAEAYIVWFDRSLFDARLNRLVRGRVEGRLEQDLRQRLARIQGALPRALK